MKRLLFRLDGMPLPLRALSAYSALCAWALIALGLTEVFRDIDNAWVLLVCASGLLLGARLMTLPTRLAWWALMVTASAAMVTAFWLGNNASTGAAVMLLILALPSTRAFFDEGERLPVRIR
ncbi:MAG: hypothetical protein QOG99_2383 [Frankiales bacterium]|jgi:hypothetical protein|nr:hypothetical protein [Frankiales bacterium]